ncbi:MAG TPA: hypothetical protein PK005_00090 [Bacteroidales bacterium]|jgi:hypothetical protein|nr:hypothetical protein [Bacteroidales bacterium]HOC48357.1 hypothetical protein [Bacteroidales bacterium]HOR10298.1 hypothetical protein [Bacteroidales bacterium]HPK85820.1 hypothetical protein [Bacteroidales bacterium]HQG20797.1 hypothetical protein [Bacteroidales bacterium]
MISEKTNRILLWFNLILILIITSAVITFLVMKRSGEKQTNDPGVINSMDMLRKELNLTDEQYRTVLLENDRTIRKYNIVFDMMCETNVAMLEELAKEVSDPAVLDSLSRKVGTLSVSLRRHTTDYFMNLKSICNEDQQKELTEILKRMMQIDELCKSCNKRECPRKERINNIGK